ncbi:hypothetical protein AB0L65_33170 [Nonomuraea sp. NPDC052116]|uniref:hypothetical protein n=1 Tax=Nonomuraea sp. NPDC052116 TaxID=3155665 RepID=UPI00343E6614
MPDVYPNDLTARLRQMEKDIEELKALLGSREPLTAASKGWRLSNMTIPTVSSGQAHIGANNNEIFGSTINGTKYMLAKAPNPGTVSSSVGDTYTTFTRDAINDVISKFNSLVSGLSGAGHIT